MKRKVGKWTAWVMSGVLIIQISSSVFPMSAMGAKTGNGSLQGLDVSAQNPEKRPVRTLRISTAEQMVQLSKDCVLDKWSEDLVVVLEKDIDLTGSGFTSIPCFGGTFYGQGHCIKGYKVKQGGTHVGLFRYLTGSAIVRDLDVAADISLPDSGLFIGGIAGENDGLISNCSFQGTITAMENAGGIAGINAKGGVISGCTSFGKVVASHASGGIAGKNEGKILSCVNDGEVNTDAMEESSGMTSGLTDNISSSLPEAIGNFDIASLSNEEFIDIMNIGGISGDSEGVIDNCLNRGSVGYARQGYNVGGICGITKGYISNCRNDGEVFGRKDTGGIAGQIEPETIWEYSSEELDRLHGQLKDLDAKLAALVSDASAGVGNMRDHLETAEAYAADTASQLQLLIGDVSGEAAEAGAKIRDLMNTLADAVNTEDAEAAADCLKQLSELVKGTNLFAEPLTVSVQGTMDADVNTALSVDSEVMRSILVYMEGMLLSMQNSAGTRRSSPVGVQRGTNGSVGYYSAPSEAPLSEAAEDMAGEDEIPVGADWTEDGIFDQDDQTGDDSYGVDYYDEEAAADDYAVDYYDENAAADDYAVDYYDENAAADDYYVDYSDDYSGDYNDDYNVDYYDEGAAADDYYVDYYDEEAAADDDYNTIVMDMPTANAEPDAPELESGTVEAEELPDEDPEYAYAAGIAAVGRGIELSGAADLSASGSAGGNLDGNLQIGLEDALPNTDEMAALLEQLLGHAGNLLDGEAIADAKEILSELQFEAPDTEPFYTSFGNLLTSLDPLNDDAAAIASTASSDFRAVMDQMDTIYDTLFDYLADLQTVMTDEEDEEEEIPDAWQSNEGAISSCLNCGTVSADSNAGGIVGSVAYEELFDAEDILNVSQYILKSAKKRIYASVRECENRGNIAARKTTAGGIAGTLEYGIISDCVSTGEIAVSEGDYCGGIAGTAGAVITNCQTRNLLEGQGYIGGIAGKGSVITSCVSYSQIDGNGEFQGAISGQADSKVLDNRYLDRGLGGVDGVSFSGSTDPFTQADLEAARESAQIEAVEAAQESVGEEGSGSIGPETETAPKEEPEERSRAVTGGMREADASSNPVITYMVGDEIIAQVVVPFGASVTELPEVANDGDDFWVWDDFDKDAVFSDITVTGSYHRPTLTLTADGNPPLFLVEGTFYAGNDLQISANTVQVENPDDPSALVDATAYTVTVTDYEGPLKVRMKAETGGKLYQAENEEEWKEISYETDGSYIVFPLENGGTVRYRALTEREKIIPLPIRALPAEIIGGIAALLVIILLLRRRRRRRRRANTQQKS